MSAADGLQHVARELEQLGAQLPRRDQRWRRRQITSERLAKVPQP